MAHDFFYGLGFDEAAGNFQADNADNGGTGGDPVLLSVHDSRRENNASFTAAPEGMSPRLRLGIFTRSTEALTDDLDSAYSAEVILHEYSHGVSTRLVNGTGEIGCLRGFHSAAMGEGWGDYFGASYTENPRAGAYLTGDPNGGIRRFPYDDYPLTYRDLGNELYTSPHDEGEIWAVTLWELREELGAGIADQIVFDALEMTGCTPDMIGQRDLILTADQMRNEAANRTSIWDVFAARGMGYSAGGFDGNGVEGPVFTSAFDLPPDLQTGNRLPAITSQPMTRPALGEMYVYDVDAEDPDGDTLTYALSVAPDGMTIDAATGRIEWTASFTRQRVEVTVSDGNGGEIYHGFVVLTLTPLQPDEAVTISAPEDSLGLA
jgi:hypothetical protein